jgi:hypothetical protein
MLNTLNNGRKAAMRMMLRWTAPVERGNEAVEDGTMGRTIEWLLENLEPEAAYFYAENGERAGTLFFEMTDSSRLPQIAERLFMNLDAAVEFIPVMNADELREGLEKVTG